MKRFLLLAAVAVTPHFAFAQPEPAQPQTPALPRFKPTRENLGSLAVVGAFYNTMERAKSYNGHFIMKKTKMAEGKVVLEKVLDWKSQWVGQGDGNFEKRHVEALYSETVDGKKTETQTVVVDDGHTLHRFIKGRNVWSQQPHEEDENSDPSQALPFAMWMSQMLAFNQGAEFSTKTRILADKPIQLVVSAGDGFEFVLNEHTGLLESWKITSDNETTELRFLELEVNKPIAESNFAWKAPEGAQQVAPEETEQKVEL